LKNKLIISGSLPPPYGGVTIHIQRLLEHLSVSEIEYKFFNQKKSVSSILKFYCSQLHFRKDVIHVFGLQKPYVQFLLLILNKFFRKRIVVSILNERAYFFFNSYNFIQKFNAILFLKNVFRVISVNKNAQIPIVNKSKIIHISPFIFPVRCNLNQKEIPTEIRKFNSKHKYVIFANAFRIKFFNGTDLYGIDLAIEMLNQINKQRQDVGIIFHIPDVVDYDYLSLMNKRIKEFNLSNRFMFYTQPLSTSEYLSVLKSAHIFIRPTNTDGDSISIREALYLRIPTITSDATIRPEGTILFKNRKPQSLFEKGMDVINNYNVYSENSKRYAGNDSGAKLISFYNEILN
jgi:glycosyltransferase involved in cell wall biosynthesis